jgi:hypothetical protein
MSRYSLDITVEKKICWGGSWGNTQWEDVELRIRAWACMDRQRGGFEIYDIATRGEAYYGEGGLWFDEDGDLVDYDGVYDLDRDIREWIEMEVGA